MKQSTIGPGGQARNLRKMQDRQTAKTTIPLPNSLMKLIRQSEVYLMEEAVTESIIKQAHGSAEKEMQS